MKAVTDIWSLYEKGLRRQEAMGLRGDTDKAWHFYEGDQWYGLEASEQLPVYNFIAPTVKYKVANIAMNHMQIYFSPLQTGQRQSRLASVLNSLAARWWEQHKMDSICWQMLRDSAVAGESYLYIYNEAGDCQVLDNVNVFLGDETQSDVQKQPYIIIYERRNVEELRQRALDMGVPAEEAAKILSDAEQRQRVSTLPATVEDDGKCTCLLYMKKQGEDIRFVRCTKYVQLGQEQCIPGLGCYPLVSLVTAPRKGSARGRGEVLPLVTNQIEVNRNLARRIINAKMTAYSRLVYATDKIDNPEALSEVGSAIAVNDSTIADVHSAVGYVSPSPMSADAKSICDEMISVTRELAGAGNALTGNIDPTMASGAAIIAVRDQAQIPLNENLAAFRAFVEEVARVWYHLWICYLPLVLDVNEENFTALELKALRPFIRVDATSATPFSKYAREQSLEKLMDKQVIAFEEYVEALDDDSAVPKAQLLNILKQRKELINGETCEG